MIQVTSLPSFTPPPHAQIRSLFGPPSSPIFFLPPNARHLVLPPPHAFLQCGDLWLWPSPKCSCSRALRLWRKTHAFNPVARDGMYKHSISILPFCMYWKYIKLHLKIFTLDPIASLLTIYDHLNVIDVILGFMKYTLFFALWRLDFIFPSSDNEKSIKNM